MIMTFIFVIMLMVTLLVDYIWWTCCYDCYTSNDAIVGSNAIKSGVVVSRSVLGGDITIGGADSVYQCIDMFIQMVDIPYTNTTTTTITTARIVMIMRNNVIMIVVVVIMMVIVVVLKCQWVIIIKHINNTIAVSIK